MVTDNRTRKKLTRAGRKGKGPSFTLLNPNETRKVLISPQHVLAVFQYLSTSVNPFKIPFMEADVLKKLLSMDVYKEIKLKHVRANEAEGIIIQKGQRLDFFVLIIEGRVSVNVGVEELRFECGPFTYFGIQVLRDCLAECEPPAGKQARPHASLRRAHTQSALAGGDKPAAAKRQASNASTASLPVGGGGGADKESSFAAASFFSEYTVKASTDLLYLVVPHEIYAMAAKASLLQASSSPSLASKDIRKIEQMIWAGEGQASPPPILLHTAAYDDSEGEMLELLPKLKRSSSSSSPGRE